MEGSSLLFISGRAGASCALRGTVHHRDSRNHSLDQLLNFTATNSGGRLRSGNRGDKAPVYDLVGKLDVAGSFAVNDADDEFRLELVLRIRRPDANYKNSQFH